MKPKRHRPRFWRIIVGAAVVGMLVIGGGVAIWRGPGVIVGGGSGSTCAGELPVGSAGLFGEYFENPTDQTVVIHSVHTGPKTNARVVANTIIDHTHDNGIGAGSFPTTDSVFVEALSRSRPLRGYVVGPHEVVQVVVKLYPVDTTRPARLTSLVATYSVAGKPFSYESTNTEDLGSRAIGVGHC